MPQQSWRTRPAGNQDPNAQGVNNMWGSGNPTPPPPGSYTSGGVGSQLPNPFANRSTMGGSVGGNSLGASGSLGLGGSGGQQSFTTAQGSGQGATNPWMASMQSRAGQPSFAGGAPPPGGPSAAPGGGGWGTPQAPGQPNPNQWAGLANIGALPGGEPQEVAANAQNMLLNPLYASAGQAFNTALGAPVTADQLFQNTMNTMQPAYQQANNQVMADLESAGIRMGGAGYSQNTPYANLQNQYQQNMQNAALQAQIAAPQMALQNLGMASNIGMGLYGQRMNDINTFNQNRYQAGLNQYQMGMMNNMMNQQGNQGWGQTIGGLVGTGAGLGLAAMTGGASLPFMGAGGNLGSMIGGGGFGAGNQAGNFAGFM